MRILVLILTIIISIPLAAQPTYERIRDKDTKALVYVGQLSYYDLDKEPEFKWFEKGVYNYEPDIAAMAYLKSHLKDYEMVTVIGTWCEDSHELIPKLYRVLKDANYPIKQRHSLYALDLSKKGLNKEEEKYDIESVPTIILYKDGEEAGRIVESIVADTIEEDLQAIIEDFEF